MKKRLLACGLFIPLVCATAGTALAEEASPVSGSVTLVSDYSFRGLAQSNRKPALQGGIEYASAGGFYAGAWGSSISWLSDGQDSVSSNVELDGYAGYRGSWGESVTYDAGFNYYWYPGSYPSGYTSPNTLEGYFAVSFSIFTLKYNHSFTDLFGIDDGAGSGYIDFSLSQPFAETWSFDAHAGHQRIDGASDLDYSDWSIGISKDFGNGFSGSLAYIDTNAERDLYTNAFGKYLGKSTAILSLGKSF